MDAVKVLKSAVRACPTVPHLITMVMQPSEIELTSAGREAVRQHTVFDLRFLRMKSGVRCYLESPAKSFLFLALALSGIALGQETKIPNVTYSAEDNWTVNSRTDLASPGMKSVMLSSCPPGVRGNEKEYSILISERNRFEAVHVTGGTCRGDSQPGTLQFVTVNAHGAGYTIGSASGGLQEALIAARFAPTNPAAASQSGKVIVPPGELQLYARVSVRASNVTVDFSGSIVNCYMADTCIFAGDPANSSAYDDITLINPRGRPMVVGGTYPFIEVNAQKTRVFNVATRSAPAGAYFGSYVQVDDDQAFVLDGLDTTLGGNSSLQCNATLCNPAVYAPGPFNTYSAVGWLKHLNIGLQCAGNGVDWESGNTLRISDSVIQGYAQYGVRAGTARGGFGGFALENVYEEVGNCSNPLGGIGEAGVIAQGNVVKIEGGEGPTGKLPQFANTGTTNYRYYIVATSATYGRSNVLFAGHALTNGTGNITVTTPDIAGASSFDLLRVTGAGGQGEQAPFGTGNYAVATGVSRASACANGVCTFTDTQAPPASYTVGAPAYFPVLSFWPGSLVLSAPGDTNAAALPAIAFMNDVPSDTVGVLGTVGPEVVAPRCSSQSNWTPLWISCYATNPPTQVASQNALLLAVKQAADSGLLLNLKGRLNFSTLGTGPGHIITLSDSNFQKTIATVNNRPTNDVNDAYIGYDQSPSGNPALVGISFGAPVALSNYIGNVGDGTNWLERLTASLKTFKVPIATNSPVISTVPTGTAPLKIASTTPVANLTLSNHATVENCGSRPDCTPKMLTGSQIVFGSVQLAGGSATVRGFQAYSSKDSFECTASDKSSAGKSANAVPVSRASIAVTGAGTDVVSYICIGN